MRLFIDWGLLLFSALTRSRVAQSFLLSLRPSALSSIFLPPSLCIGGHAVGLATLKAKGSCIRFPFASQSQSRLDPTHMRFRPRLQSPTIARAHRLVIRSERCLRPGFYGLW